MAKRIKALVEPSLLVWARETASLPLEEAARAIGVPAEQVEAWERGEGEPSIPQLKKVANAYKRPLPVFFLPEPPTEFQPLRDFRRLSDAGERPYSAKLAFEVRAAQERRAIALDVIASLGEPPTEFGIKASVRDNPETVAKRVRERLGVTLEQQSRWGEPDKAFKAWREAIEAVGVLVFALSGAHHQVPLSEVRGFAIAEQPLPAIVVNSKDRTNGRIFTLLHELGHVVLGTSAIENDLEPPATLPAPARAIETFCNRLAAAVLMPRDALLVEPLVTAKARTGSEWTDAEIGALARRYCVSREAMLVRLVELGCADRAFYQAKRAEYAKQYEEIEDDSEGGGFAPYQYQILSHVGRGFARLVLQGYYQNRLTLSTVSGYLGTQAKHVPNIERATFNVSA
ncbi:ImmA/IrrE family metallo-endopeptidase [Microvirga sp. BT689]|uniref:ImmA/IrrE family metallo-endopeptidase n=1 Tax=Microvirga arvi TaxID=2778731 RepID=UPI00194EA5CA|nr:ImmA/IrrE family metallo-endopeptidase [Microvirga arvi]MBM6582988.1 ImmA/IrrE family metallo-endopeptidase [Microvirga arvi]